MLDSVGGEYQTDLEAGCFPTVGDATPIGECEDPESAGVVFTFRRFFAGCPACDAGFGPVDCRPLVCESDADCPWFRARDLDGQLSTLVYECRSGICQDENTEKYPKEAVDRDDASLLCLAPIDREDGVYEGEPPCPEAAPGDHDALCDLPLPATCLQP
jgi:hypothetical protein